MSTDSTRTIVVGYDGSPSSHAAITHAVDRLGDGGHLVVVHAHDVPGDYVGASYYQAMLTANLEANEVVKLSLESDVRLASVDWEADFVAGRAADVIARVARTRGADEIVIGTRGLGRVRALLGSVAHEVIHQAECPVTVIPERMVDMTAADAGDALLAIG
jgi:nucleotide-binding universal stress UspA family protein